MRVLLAGATGAIGRRLLPQLLAEGHEVTAMVRSAARVPAVAQEGVDHVVADALDRSAVAEAIARAKPDAVIHQLTALPRRIDPRRIERDFAVNDRLRSEGTRHLVEGAQAAGATRIIAQSIAFAYAPGPRGTLHQESDALLSDTQAPRAFRRSAAALRDLERAVLGADGLVMRYGYFYGPGSALSREGSMCEDLSRRRLPIVGGGGGVWSFIHVDDAAAATVAALTRGAPGPYNIVDDDPAPVSQWLPALAEAIAAPRPLRVPALLALPAAGRYGVATMTRAQGASNAHATRELGFTPRFASWREGFREGLG